VADLTQTVSNTIVVLGVSPPTVWNGFNWGTGLWGNDGDVSTQLDKAIANATSIDTGAAKEVEKSYSTTLTASEDLQAVFREIGIYDYIATRPTTNWVSQVVDGSTKVPDITTSMTTASEPSTTWTVV
jgi:hypothetical protein